MFCVVNCNSVDLQLLNSARYMLIIFCGSLYNKLFKLKLYNGWCLKCQKIYLI